MTAAGARSGLMPCFLGIDLGTSSAKAVVVDTTGKVVGQGSGNYPICHPHPTHAEQDPASWWQAVIQATHQATRTLPATHTMAALGVTGQMHGTVLLDAEMRVLAPVIIWPDQRSHAEVTEITQAIVAETLVALTGSPLATGFQAATLAWLRRHQPELWRAIRHVLLPKDYVRWQLTGELATDASDAAGTLLFNVTTRTWANQLLDLLAIDPAWLPPIQPSTRVAGTLQPTAADALGLRAGLPVVTGAADTPCSALGAGITTPDTLLLTLSSGGQLLIPASTPRIDPHGRTHTFCSALEPESGAGWYQMAALLNVGLVLRWLRDELWQMDAPDAYAQIVEWASRAPAGAKDLIFLPYFMGERTPYMDAHARGALLGLTLAHGRAEIARAALEGITLACYNAFTVLQATGAQPSRIVVAGGGATSAFWRQLIADIFGQPIYHLAAESTVESAAGGTQSAIGAALLAGAGTGHFELLATAQAWSSAAIAAPIQPNLDAHATYQQLLPHFRHAYDQIRYVSHLYPHA